MIEYFLHLISIRLGWTEGFPGRSGGCPLKAVHDPQLHHHPCYASEKYLFSLVYLLLLGGLDQMHYIRVINYISENYERSG